MKNKIILFAVTVLFVMFSGCAQMRYSMQEGEHQYVIKGDMKAANFFGREIIQKMGYILDPYKTVEGTAQSVVLGVIVHEQVELGNRVASTVLSVLFAPAPKKNRYGKTEYEDPARKVVDHYEDHRVIVIKKRWDPTGEFYVEGELGVVVEGGKYGKNGQGEIVESDEISWDHPDRESIGRQIQEALNAYKAKYRKK